LKPVCRAILCNQVRWKVFTLNNVLVQTSILNFPCIFLPSHIRALTNHQDPLSAASQMPPPSYVLYLPVTIASPRYVLPPFFFNFLIGCYIAVILPLPFLWHN
jgi:hypothetical protein